MTKEQVDILIQDGDIIPENPEPVYIRDIKRDLPPILNTPIIPIGGERFRISAALDELLNYVYDESLKIAVKLKHEQFQTEIEALTDNDLPKKHIQQYFESKIQEQMKAKEALIVEYHLYRSIDGIKRFGMSKMCLKLEEIIGCIKFKIFKGGKIESLGNEKKIAAFTVLYKYFFFVDELKEIIKAVSIEKNIKFLQEKINEIKVRPSKSKGKSKTDFSHKEIAIAYYISGELLNESNGNEVLKKYSKNKSVPKLLDCRIYKISELTKITDNKTANSKHLIALENAKRLIIIQKNKKAEKDITRIISTFQSNLIVAT